MVGLKGDATGEEICTDEYGRVKLRFHWLRANKNKQPASCWVRVSQAWAGAGWGAWHLPRVGHEVIVDFLDGDPDRPIVTGCVYYGLNHTPYKLPEQKTRSGFRAGCGTNLHKRSIR